MTIDDTIYDIAEAMMSVDPLSYYEAVRLEIKWVENERSYGNMDRSSLLRSKELHEKLIDKYDAAQNPSRAKYAPAVLPQVYNNLVSICSALDMIPLAQQRMDEAMQKFPNNSRTRERESLFREFLEYHKVITRMKRGLDLF